MQQGDDEERPGRVHLLACDHRRLEGAHAVAMTIRVVRVETATRLQPSDRSRVAAGGLTATIAPVSSPGAAAISTDETSHPVIARTPITRTDTPDSMSAARRVAAAAQGSPPPLTRKTTTRTASVVVVNSNANGIATAR